MLIARLMRQPKWEVTDQGGPERLDQSSRATMNMVIM
jgi:hypothetical protein